jgi:hypothetical protein
MGGDQFCVSEMGNSLDVARVISQARTDGDCVPRKPPEPRTNGSNREGLQPSPSLLCHGKGRALHPSIVTERGGTRNPLSLACANFPPVINFEICNLWNSLISSFSFCLGQQNQSLDMATIHQDSHPGVVKVDFKEGEFASRLIAARVFQPTFIRLMR